MNLADMTYDNATHRLRCTHATGVTRKYYTMRCHLIRITKAGMCKILVFGDRYWPGRNHRSRVRYVTRDRLTKIREEELRCR